LLAIFQELHQIQGFIDFDRGKFGLGVLAAVGIGALVFSKAPARRVAYAAPLTAIVLLGAVLINAAQDKLLEASEAGDLSRVKFLLAVQTNVNAKALYNYTPLILASSNGHLDVVRALLAAGADVNAQAAGGITALGVAWQHGHLDVLRLLLAAGADVNAGNGDVLNGASGAGNLELVRTLLAAGADVKRGPHGGPLYGASMNGHLDVVRALLAAGADVNAGNGEALFSASQSGRLEVVRALLAAGADVNAQSFNGETAMSLAIKGGFAEIVQLLKASAPVPDK
jgi:uncharacterized protein